MSFYERLTADLTWAEHAALAALRAAAQADASIHALSAESPEIAAAVAEGKRIAEANGVPVETVEETVLRLAKEFANGPAAA